MAAKAPFVSEKLAKRKRLLRTVRIIFYSVVFIALTLLTWWFSHAKAFQIATIEVSGAAVISADDITADTNSALAGSYAFIFPKTQIFWYPKTHIQKLLLSKYPRIQNVTLSKKGSTLNVAVTERVPKYLWCGETVPDTSAEAFTRDCYFTDENGFVFATAPNFSDAVYIKLYAAVLSPEAPIGSLVFTRETLTHIDTFASGIKSAMIVPYAYVTDSNNDVSILLISSGNQVPRVLYNTSMDPVTSSMAFRSAVGTEPLASKLKKSFSALEYIDTRFDKKIFYKFAESEKIEQTANSNDGAGTKPQ